MPDQILYSPKEFANRQAYISLVAEDMQRRDGLLNLFGVTGMGKSWLLKHLRHLYRQQDEVLVLYLDCLQLPEQDRRRAILHSLSTQLAEQSGFEEEKAASAQALVSRLVDLQETHSILFLVDATERLDVDTDDG
ncbi:MAG: AAA family ATPase, partial [Chloroflexota bacterium]|nr:AAA family ATPase [Chloroflexota bacterium]